MRLALLKNEIFTHLCSWHLVTPSDLLAILIMRCNLSWSWPRMLPNTQIRPKDRMLNFLKKNMRCCRFFYLHSDTFAKPQLVIDFYTQEFLSIFLSIYHITTADHVFMKIQYIFSLSNTINTLNSHKLKLNACLFLSFIVTLCHIVLHFLPTETHAKAFLPLSVTFTNFALCCCFV